MNLLNYFGGFNHAPGILKVLSVRAQSVRIGRVVIFSVYNKVKVIKTVQ